MPFELNPPAPDQGLGWFQAGAMIGARNADRALQAQELRSKEAERVVRERNLAAELQHIELQNQQLNVAIQKRAADEAEFGSAMHSADAAYAVDKNSSDEIIARGGDATQPPQLSYRIKAAQQIGDNPHSKELMDNIGMFQARQALAEKNIEQPVLKKQELTDRALLNKAKISKLDEETQMLSKGGKLKPSEFERNVNFINEQRVKAGDPELSPAEFMDMAKRHMGVLPKASAAGQWFDKAEVTALVKEHGELQKEINDLQTSAPPRTKAQREQRAQSIAAKLARQTKIDSDIEAKRTKVESALKGEAGAAPSTEYKTAEDVRSDFRAGKLQRDEAMQILKDKFGQE